jgi:hypothetical protein
MRRDERRLVGDPLLVPLSELVIPRQRLRHPPTLTARSAGIETSGWRSAADMVGNLVSRVTTVSRAELGDLRVGRNLAVPAGGRAMPPLNGYVSAGRARTSAPVHAPWASIDWIASPYSIRLCSASVRRSLAASSAASWTARASTRSSLAAWCTIPAATASDAP